LASLLTALSSSVVINSSSLAASVSTSQTTTAAISGSIVDLKSQYTVKVTAGNRVAGFRLAADASTSSSFIVQVDEFKIVQSNGTGTIVPFTVDGGGVYLDSAYVRNLNASAITAGTISAGRGGAGSITAGRVACRVLQLQHTEIAAGTTTAANMAAGTITGTQIAATRSITGRFLLLAAL
jgi:hypothetical protein